MKRLLPVIIAACGACLAGAENSTQGQYFAKKAYEPTPLPEFGKTKPLLQSPIYDANPGYADLYWKAWELGFPNFHDPNPGGKERTFDICQGGQTIQVSGANPESK